MELEQRAIACKKWRWIPGMFTDVGLLIAVILHDGAWQTSKGNYLYPKLPDLNNPATIGCLLALVREMYFDKKKLWNGYVEVHRDHRLIFNVDQFGHDKQGGLITYSVGNGQTEAEALVSALENWRTFVFRTNSGTS